jgi:hypothetical protein
MRILLLSRYILKNLNSSLAISIHNHKNKFTGKGQQNGVVLYIAYNKHVWDEILQYFLPYAQKLGYIKIKMVTKETHHKKCPTMHPPTHSMHW